MDGELHVYAQQYWHTDAYLVGDKEALIKLRDRIDEAIEKGASTLEASCGDGEGYYLRVVCHDGDFGMLMSPYVDEVARESRENFDHPWELFERTGAPVRPQDNV